MNVTELIRENAKRFPDRKAIVRDGHPKSILTFRQFSEQANGLALALENLGIGSGKKVAFFVKPSLEFHLTIFALFQIGAVPIFIDPGVGLKQLLSSIEGIRPEILIAEPFVLVLRKCFRKAFASVRLAFNPCQLLARAIPTAHLPIRSPELSTTAAIIFTSGATGAAKGVVYTHQIFRTQVELLSKILPAGEGDTDLSCFPIFSLFSLALGMTSVIPEMNASKPAQVNARKIVRAIQEHQAALATGSPAIWERVADFCLKHQLTLPSLRGILMFGAPVSIHLHQKLESVLTNGTTYTPYGATECLPVAWISGREILQDCQHLTLQGKGTCVGTPFPATCVKIIRETDKPIEWKLQIEECKPFSIGEIVVCGKQTTHEYYENIDATSSAKIKDLSGNIWHRMGDLGYKDENGRLWFCGRKVHKFETAEGPLHPIMCEAVFNQHNEVRRTALVGISKGTLTIPCLVVERKDGRTKLSKAELTKFEAELAELGAAHKATDMIKTFRLFRNFPVDCRHNIKIDRIALRDFFAQHETKGDTYGKNSGDWRRRFFGKRHKPTTERERLRGQELLSQKLPPPH